MNAPHLFPSFDGPPEQVRGLMRVGGRDLRAQGLRADLDAWRGLLDKARPAASQQLRHWLRDPDFAGVRGPDALAKLLEAERQDWQKLWADVERVVHGRFYCGRHRPATCSAQAEATPKVYRCRWARR